MGYSKAKTFSNFIQNNKKIAQVMKNQIDVDDIRDYTYKFSEILKCFDVDAENLKKNGEYQIFHEDEDFVVKIIQEDFRKEYIRNIRKEKFGRIEINYIENIIKGLINMLSKIIKDEEVLNTQINKIYRKTRIRVREKSNEIESLMETIVANIKELYSDDLYQLQKDQTIISQLTELQNGLQSSYAKFINMTEDSLQTGMKEALKDIREFNSKNDVKNSNDVETLKDNIVINRSINYWLYNNEEYKKLEKELDEEYDRDKTKNLKKRKINKKVEKIEKLRNDYKEKILSMCNEELEQLKKQSPDIRSYIRKE